MKALDAATPPTFEQYARAADTLDRIVATPLEESERSETSKKKQLRTWMLVPALAAAAAVLLVLAPWGRSSRAYATWTPVPVPLSADESGLVGPACRKQLSGSAYLDLDHARLVLAERRGEYVALLYRTENPDMAGFCLAHNVPGTNDVDEVKSGSAGGSGPAETTPAGRFTEGALASFPAASITNGAAGVGVTGLTIHTGGLTVEATVRDGRWVAWWPGQAIAKDEEGEWRDVPRTYDVLMNDGRVIKNAQPAS
ncbi:hypothetical protein KOI35_16490 [Actinoplanes bogorensis]|uniref:Uncharacterized protein n=1 Tax=Paractinoplanes bogorensis TaxID=1610840 RepID=A0ABS5YNR0_9ACTN|nr:hypothetical protein [Actinoplanes bogorensis]MBU2665102.1 hypothetical protein [Actinoplanes bogorensis]